MPLSEFLSRHELRSENHLVLCSNWHGNRVNSYEVIFLPFYTLPSFEFCFGFLGSFCFTSLFVKVYWCYALNWFGRDGFQLTFSAKYLFTPCHMWVNCVNVYVFYPSLLGENFSPSGFVPLLYRSGRTKDVCNIWASKGSNRVLFYHNFISI